MNADDHILSMLHQGSKTRREMLTGCDELSQHRLDKALKALVDKGMIRHVGRDSFERVSLESELPTPTQLEAAKIIDAAFNLMVVVDLYPRASMKMALRYLKMERNRTGDSSPLFAEICATLERAIGDATPQLVDEENNP